MTKKKIQKEKYIRLRKGKKSNSYQIDIPYSFGNETFHFVQTLNTADFEYDDGATLLAARIIRDKKLQEIDLGKMRGRTPFDALYHACFLALYISFLLACRIFCRIKAVFGRF